MPENDTQHSNKKKSVKLQSKEMNRMISHSTTQCERHSMKINLCLINAIVYDKRPCGSIYNLPFCIFVQILYLQKSANHCELNPNSKIE